MCLSKNFVIYLNSASSTAALVFYLLGVCVHTLTPRENRVRNILKNSEKNLHCQDLQCGQKGKGQDLRQASSTERDCMSGMSAKQNLIMGLLYGDHCP